MARVFAVTASTSRLSLDAEGPGEVSFTISNSEQRLLRSRAVVKPQGAAQADWFTIMGESEKELPVDGTHQVTVRVAVPATASGTFNFQLRVVSVDDPDEDWSDSPVVAVEAPEAPTVTGGFPWWILIVVGLVVVVAGGAVAWYLTRLPGLGEECRGDRCAEGLVCGPEGTCVEPRPLLECNAEDPLSCGTGLLECVGGVCRGAVGFQGCEDNAECAVAPCLSRECAGDRTLDPCASSAECSPFQICAADRGLCLRETGQPCEAPGQCASNMCGASGTCEAPGIGQPCQAGACGSGLECTSANVCLASAGFACSSNPECADGLCRGGKCVADATGSPCASRNECSPNQTCRNGICQRNTGQACQVGGQCLSQICEGRRCVARAVGAACSADVNCTTFYCLDRRCFQRRGHNKPCSSGNQCRSKKCKSGRCTKPLFTPGQFQLERRPVSGLADILGGSQ